MMTELHSRLIYLIPRSLGRLRMNILQLLIQKVMFLFSRTRGSRWTSIQLRLMSFAKGSYCFYAVFLSLAKGSSSFHTILQGSFMVPSLQGSSVDSGLHPNLLVDHLAGIVGSLHSMVQGKSV
ncbi:hypothetical protein CRENBAI_019895 [Crenichthys baileyi]|uniref:Uncharacterized protein n=1 Tax=Crenichthys baileyi TaxID=28760 RepID=A0AAV9SRR0_9TELE